MIKIILALSLILSLVACGLSSKKQVHQAVSYQTLPATEKIGPFLQYVGEMTPIVWKGKLLAVIRAGQNVEIVNVFTKATVAVFQEHDFDLISALVAHGRVYVFGTSGLNYKTYAATPGNRVQMISSADLAKWTKPVTVYQASPQMTVYNTSVAPDPRGYVMALEVTENGSIFHERFAHSVGQGLSAFKPVGGVLHPHRYSSCPTIRYVDGRYYVIYDESKPPYYMAFISRSADLYKWRDQRGGYVPFSPIDGPSYESRNGVQAIDNSDVDLAEYNGYVYFLYDYGDQATWGGYGIARYHGTLSEYVKKFFSD